MCLTNSGAWIPTVSGRGLITSFPSREGQVMWLRAVTMPETTPRLRSSHMSTKTNSRVSRHIYCAHKYLVRKGQSQSDPGQFKKQLYDIWFRLYHRDRSGGEDSCGFEHVFVGETKFDREIMGLHNWIQFYLQEKHNHIDYKGYKAREGKDTPDEDDHVLNLQFSWKGLVKPIGGSFIGVSPEFEVALFTIIFLMSTEKRTSVVVKVDEYALELVVYRHRGSIGTSYPTLLSSNHRDL
ncbi:uridylate-specific endoribonuclease C-like isoform X2 [Sander vitreus]